VFGAAAADARLADDLATALNALREHGALAAAAMSGALSSRPSRT
jgi:hypothetical protein